MKMKFFFIIIINFEHVFVSCAWIKSTEQLKCTLNKMAVSLRHVHVTWISQNGLINPQTIEINVHMIIATGIQLEEGWAG